MLRNRLFRLFASARTSARVRTAGALPLRLETLDDRALPSVVTWVNPSGGDWDTASNWSTGAVPGAGDDVVISTAGITVTHTSFFTSDSVNSITSAATLNISNGSLSVASTSTIADLVVSGGTLTGTGNITVTGALAWSNGTISDTGTTALEGTSTITGGTFGPSLSAGTLENEGAATLTGGSLLFASNATWQNDSGSTLTLTDGGSLGNFFGSSGQLNNAGTVVQTGADNSTSTVSIPVDNTGTIRVKSGTLQLNDAVTNDGALVLSAGAVASVSGALTNDGSVTLGTSAAASVSDGTSTGTIQLGSNATLTATGTFTQSGSVALAKGSALDIGGGFSSPMYTLAGGATVTGAGAVDVGGGELDVTGAASVTNLSVTGGTVEVESAGGALTATNLTLTGGTVSADGTLEVQTATLTGGTLTGAGTATVDGAFSWTGSDMSGTGTTLLEGTSTITGGTFGPTLDTRTLENAGAATVTGGSLLFANDATWQNDAGATLTLTSGASLGNFFGSSGQLINNGTLETTGNGQATIDFGVTNNGTVDLAGVLVIAGNYTQTSTGTLDIHLGGTTAGSQYDQLQVQGTATLDGTLSVKLVDGFTPVAGDSFDILTFGSVSGDFATEHLPKVSGLVFDPTYDATALSLVVESK